MKVQIVSDTHGEFPDGIEMQEECDLLILGGDIGFPKYPEAYRDLIERYHDTFSCPIVLIRGNHEAYGMTWEESFEVVRNVCDEFERVHFLENSTIEVCGVTIIGSVLWSYVPPEQSAEVDMCMEGQISGVGVKEANQLHAECVRYIRKSLSKWKWKRILVVTHFAPLLNTSDPMYDTSPIRSAYSTNLEYLVRMHTVIGWVYGHTHYNKIQSVGGRVVMSNQYGCTTKERRGFRANRLFEFNV